MKYPGRCPRSGQTGRQWFKRLGVALLALTLGQACLAAAPIELGRYTVPSVLKVGELPFLALVEGPYCGSLPGLPPSAISLREDTLDIEITLWDGICIGTQPPALSGIPLGSVLGPLPAGSYMVRLTERRLDEAGAVLASETFEGGPLIVEHPARGEHLDRSLDPYAGAWFRPGQPGDGFVVVANGKSVTILFFGRDAEGEPLWLVSAADGYGAGGRSAFWMRNKIWVEMFRSAGGVLGDPSQELEPWGTLTVTFESCTSALFVLDGPGEAVEYETQKLTSSLAVAGC